MIKIITTGALLATAGLLFAPTANADPSGNTWAAIAYSTTTGKANLNYNASSQLDAGNAAVSACNQASGDNSCKVVAYLPVLREPGHLARPQRQRGLLRRSRGTRWPPPTPTRWTACRRAGPLRDTAATAANPPGRSVVVASDVDDHATAGGPRNADQHFVVPLGGTTTTLDMPAQQPDLARPAESLPTGVGRPRIVVEHDVEC